MDLLLVEDDGGVRETLSQLLSEAGFQIEDVETAEAGLLLIEARGLPKVLIADAHLGAGMGGFALAETLTQQRREIPVVFISGRPELLSSLILKECHRALIKPFTYEALLTAVEEVLTG